MSERRHRPPLIRIVPSPVVNELICGPEGSYVPFSCSGVSIDLPEGHVVDYVLEGRKLILVVRCVRQLVEEGHVFVGEPVDP
jgi:hypothetical protein